MVILVAVVAILATTKNVMEVQKSRQMQKPNLYLGLHKARDKTIIPQIIISGAVGILVITEMISGAGNNNSIVNMKNPSSGSGSGCGKKQWEWWKSLICPVTC